MQKIYELVVLLNPQLSKDDQDAINNKIDTLLGAGKKDTDAMGLVQLAHPIGKARLTQVHMTSYYCELTPAQTATIKQELTLTKGVVRHVFFAMTANQPFLTFAGVNQKFNKAAEEKAAAAAAIEVANAEAGVEKKPELTRTTTKKKEQMVRKGYFNKDSHREEITWKATKLLTFYITRFGDMKPRKFMGNSVSQQKRVRQAILRARELGVIAYANA